MHDFKNPSPKMVIVAGFLTVFFLLSGVTASAAATEPSKSPEQNYIHKVSVIDSEIDVLNQDTAWLKFKIERFKNDGRLVPEAFHRSLALKEKKLNALVFLKKKYLQMVDKAPAPQFKQTEKVSTAPKTNEAPALAAKPPTTGASIEKNGLFQKIKETGLSEWVELVEDKDLLKIENSLPILFASGKAAIAKEYQPFFKSLADLVKSYDVRIIVEGYADPDPIRTRQYPSNFELGAARAANVVHELTRYGIKPSVFKIESTGEHRFSSKKQSDMKALERHVRVTVLFRT